MRRLGAFVIAVVLGALVAAGCGGSSGDTTRSNTGATAPTTRPVSEDARARASLGAAIRKLMARPYRARISVHTSFDVEGAPREVQQALGGLATDTSGTIEAESPRRMSGALRVPLGTGVMSMRIVLYDGTGYFSKDGRDWRRLGGELVSLIVEPALSVQARDLSANLVGVRPGGRTTFGGAPALRYSGAIDPRFMRRTIGPIFQRAGLDPAFLQFEGGEGSFVVRSSDGQLVLQQGTVTASLDLSKLPGGPQGRMSIRSATQVRYVDQGAAIHIVRPHAAGTVSTLLQLGAFLSGAP